MKKMFRSKNYRLFAGICGGINFFFFSIFVDTFTLSSIIGAENMCLSKVFMKSVDENSVIVDEASKIVCRNDTVEINTLFGEKKVLKGYVINEVDLIKNQVILGERE